MVQPNVESRQCSVTKWSGTSDICVRARWSLGTSQKREEQILDRFKWAIDLIRNNTDKEKLIMMIIYSWLQFDLDLRYTVIIELENASL